jgi:glycosyltransferase involved in cell wall biosynthesis
MSVMRVAYVTSFYPPERIAGAELGTEFMANFMHDCGDEVHVLITRPNLPKYKKESRGGVTIHWLPYLPFRGLRLPSEILVALFCLSRLKPDIVHGNCLLPGGAVAGLYGKWKGLPSVVLCYGYDVADMKGWTAKLGRLSLGWVKKVMVATRHCGLKVKEHRPDLSSEVFYAGCDERVFCCPEDRTSETQKERGLSEVHHLLFIGRMIPEKGFDFLLELMLKLPEDLTLQVIGGGDGLTEVEAKVSEMGLQHRLEFVGLVANADLPKYFSKSDVFILPSYREPFGVVCIEAILSGVPVVCSDVMGLPEAVAHEKNGLVVSGRDHAHWLEAIERALSDKVLRASCLEQAQVMRSQWSWTAQLEKLRGAYLSLLKMKTS